MTQSNLLELAKQGHPDAIATLLARQFQPKGIAATVTLREDCLLVAIAASRVPKRTTFSAYVRDSFSKLAPEGIYRVEICGYQQGDSHPAWQDAFDLSSPPSPHASHPPHTPLWLQWVLANLRGILVFLVLQHVFLFLGLIPRLYDPLGTGLLFATAIAASAQSSCLQKRLFLGDWWIPATLGGLGARAIAIPFLPPLFAVGAGLVASTLMQWWVLRPSLRRDLLWIWGSLGGLVAGVGIGSGVARVLAMATRQTWPLTFAIALGFLTFSAIQGKVLALLLLDSPTPKPRSRRDARFATLWGLAATSGFLAFVTLADMGGRGWDALLGHGFYGCVVGTIAGGWQFLTLKQKLPQSDRWLWGTIAGYALFFGLSGLVGVNSAGFTFFLAVGGAIVGTMQWWWVLREQLPRSHWWIAGMAIGGLLTGWSRNGLSGGLIAGGMMLWLLSASNER